VRGGFTVGSAAGVALTLLALGTALGLATVLAALLAAALDTALASGLPAALTDLTAGLAAGAAASFVATALLTAFGGLAGWAAAATFGVAGLAVRRGRWIAAALTGLVAGLVAGAVAGGGLTVIANAPNPAGAALLRGGFKDHAIGVGALFIGALLPTALAALFFLIL